MAEPPPTSLPPSPLYDLLVVLGASRFGTDWPNVSASIKVALAPLEARDMGCTEPPSAAECEERFRVLVEGVPSELSATAVRLQAQRLESLLAKRAGLVQRIKLLCQQLPPESAARPAAAFSEPPGGGAGIGDGDGGSGDARASAGGSGGRASSKQPAETAPENELEENWAQIAEEEERNPRRATVSGTLNKMMQAVAKHKWAYPFKRPVTDKEAPDYKDIIQNPMDFTTLKRRIETGAVVDVTTLVTDLNLIFDNAMVYNGKGTDYYKMAQTLKDAVRAQQQMYTTWRQENGGSLKRPAEEAPAAPEDEGDAVAGDGDGDVSGSSAPAPRRGRRGART